MRETPPCTIRDHVKKEGPSDREWAAQEGAVSAYGVYVAASARGKATIGADCTFARNAGGNVVREKGGARAKGADEGTEIIDLT